jgi:predicted nucleotidyltransferase
MNAPDINRNILKRHVQAVEAALPIHILGLLPRGSVGHVEPSDAHALEFLAEKREGLSLFDLAQAEIDLSERLGRTVGIVLVSGLRGREAKELPEMVEAL